jgi:teichuronic acid biosynthesis glycosyltransferase TuaG
MSPDPRPVPPDFVPLLSPLLVESGQWPDLKTSSVPAQPMGTKAVSIGVAVPVHQNADVIENTVEAILANLEPQDRIALVENGSRDGSLALILEKYSSNPQVLIDTLESGDAARARNRAVEMLKGVDFIAFCDGDDVWLPQRLARVRIALAASGADLLVQPLIARTAHGVEIEGATFRTKSLPKHQTLLADLLFAGNFISTSAFVVRNPFLASPVFANGLKRTQDYEAWCHFAAAHPLPIFCYLDEPAAYYRRAGGLSDDRWQRAANVFGIRRSYAQHLPRAQRLGLWIVRHIWLLGWAMRTGAGLSAAFRVVLARDDSRWFRGSARSP